MASADDSPISGGARKSAAATAAAAAAPRPPEHGLNCPRCDSPNTKFCYYNNYSLTQPRHFCKTCRRYWTKGGALRNVPVGGGCRKAKKSKSSMPSAMPSRLAPDFSNAMAGGSEPAAGIKFLDGIGPGSADFQLGVIPFSGRVGVASGAGATSAFGYTIPTGIGGGAYGDNVTCGSSVLSSHHSGGIAASIESLSSINQELHWKLQQQRLAMLFGGEAYSKESSSSTMVAAAAAALPTPLLDGQQESISFQMPKSPRGELCVSNGSKNWFLESSYTNPAAAAAASTSGNNNNSSGSTSNWSGIAAWNDMYHFTALP